MRPFGAYSVADVAIVRGASAALDTDVRDTVPRTSDAFSAMEDVIFAYPKYSPDLFAENMRYTVFAACSS